MSNGMPWALLQIEIDGDTVWVELSDGRSSIQVITDVEIVGRFARLYGCHFLGDGANRLGPRKLLSLAAWAKRELDVDELRIEGATRTSGAGPGRVPPVLVF